MSTRAQLLAGAKIKIAGAELSEQLMQQLVEVRVEQSLALPSACLVRIADPALEQIDAATWAIGADVEILLAGTESRRLTSVFKGQIVALQPEFTERGAHIVLRGYDRGHLLTRERRTMTYQAMTAGDIARKLAGQVGLSAGTIDDPGVQSDFEQQSAETDWQFLWRLARRYDREVTVEDKKLHFRSAGGPAGAPTTLLWGENLISFRPRLTGAQQVGTVEARGWDPKTKRAFVASSPAPAPASTPGRGRAAGVKDLPTNTVRVATAAVTIQGEATALAKSVAARLANAYVEAEGACFGIATLAAGSRIKVEGVGRTYGGSYVLTSVTHVYRSTGGNGYETHFTIGGRSSRTLVDLVSPAAPRGFGESLVVGLVTNNKDPDAMGRVRVKYPALGDDTEGWWARVIAPQAGAARGLLFTPLVGDEVVVGFEGGDVRRPYVLGSVWNGTSKPAELSQVDGSLGITSPKSIAVKAADGAIAITAVKGQGGPGDFSLTTDGKITEKATQDLSLEGQTVKAKAHTQLSAEGATVAVKSIGALSAEGATVTVKGKATVTVEAGGAMTVKGTAVTIQASGILRLSGSQIMLG
jgi:uncharacterized protein involved in type VI secretion and phage assembly